MAQNKNQHYIPQSYLKAWTDPEAPSKYEPYVWVFNKKDKEPKKKAPSNIFRENNMYTIYDENGKRDLRLEHGLSDLESRFSKLREQKIDKHEKLSLTQHFLLCAFIAAMWARTKVQRENIRTQWKQPLNLMRQMKKELDEADKKEREKLLSMPSPPSLKGKGLKMEDVEKILENPLQEMLGPMIAATTPLLAKIDCLIFTTDHEVGFATSDAPCIWADPQAYKRPPLYRIPALKYETIEITFPISPNSCALLNRQSLNGYRKANFNELSEINKRIIRNCGEHFIARKVNLENHWLV